jgi:hypothetical protein
VFEFFRQQALDRTFSQTTKMQHCISSHPCCFGQCS